MKRIIWKLNKISVIEMVKEGKECQSRSRNEKEIFCLFSTKITDTYMVLSISSLLIKLLNYQKLFFNFLIKAIA